MAKAKYIDTILRFKDKFSGEANRAIQEAEKVKKKSEKLANMPAPKGQTFIDAGKKIEKYGKSVEKVGKNLTKSVTAPIAAVGVAAVKTAADFENSIAKVSTIADSSKVPVDKMRESILNLSDQTGISAELIAEDVYNAISAGQKTEDAVKFVEKSSKLAKAGFADSASALDILTTIMNSYGFSSDKAGKVSDMLIQTQNKGKTTVAQLASSMGKVVPTAKAYGVGLEQVCAGYVKMTANGISTAESTTYMNSMLNELGKSSTGIAKTLKKETGKSFKDLMKSGYSVADCLEIVNKSAKKQGLQFTDMFSSSEAAKAGLNILGDSASSFNETVKEMNNSTGVTDEAFKKVDTTTERINKMINRVKNTVKRLGGTILTMIMPYVEIVLKKVNKLTEWLSSLNENQQKTIIRIAGIVAAVGPVLLVVGKAVKTFGTVVRTVGKVGKAIGNMRKGVGLAGKIFGAMNLKVLLVIGVIAALAVGAYFLIKNWDKVKAFFIGLGERFKEFAGKVSAKFNEIKGKCAETVTNIIGKVKGFVSNMINSGGVLGAVFQNIRNRISALRQIFSNLIGFVKNVFTGNWSAAWQNVKGIFSGVFQGLIAAAKAPLNAVIGLINRAIGSINKIHVKIPEWVPGVGGKEFGASFKTIPYLAKGTKYFAGGKAVINEKGGEIVDLPRGSRVIPHDESVREAYRTGQRQGGRTVKIEKLADTIIVREDADIDRIAEKLYQKLKDADDNAA